MKITLGLVTLAAAAVALVSAHGEGKKCKIGGTKPMQKCPKGWLCVAEMGGKWGDCHEKCMTGTENTCPDGDLCHPLTTEPGGPGYCTLDICLDIEEKAAMAYETVSKAIVEDYKSVMDARNKMVMKDAMMNYKGCVVNSDVPAEMCKMPGTYCLSGDEEHEDSGFCAMSWKWCTIGQKDACPAEWTCKGGADATAGHVGLCVAKDAKSCEVGTEDPCGEDMMCEGYPGHEMPGAMGVCIHAPCDGEGHDLWHFQMWVMYSDVQAWYHGLPEMYQKQVVDMIKDMK